MTPDHHLRTPARWACLVVEVASSEHFEAEDRLDIRARCLQPRQNVVPFIRSDNMMLKVLPSGHLADESAALHPVAAVAPNRSSSGLEIQVPSRFLFT